MKLKCKVLFFKTTADNSNNAIFTKRHELNPNCNSDNLCNFDLTRKVKKIYMYVSKLLYAAKEIIH